SRLPDFFDAALHVEVVLGDIVVLAVENLLEAADGVGYRHLPALPAREDLRRAEWLAQEALDLPGAEHRQLVFRRELVHSQNRDDVLQILESLQHALDTAGDVVMLLAADFRPRRARA